MVPAGLYPKRRSKPGAKMLKASRRPSNRRKFTRGLWRVRLGKGLSTRPAYCKRPEGRWTNNGRVVVSEEASGTAGSCAVACSSCRPGVLASKQPGPTSKVRRPVQSSNSNYYVRRAPKNVQIKSFRIKQLIWHRNFAQKQEIPMSRPSTLAAGQKPIGRMPQV